MGNVRQSATEGGAGLLIFFQRFTQLAVFVDDVEKHRLPITIIIPKIVRRELDWYVPYGVMRYLQCINESGQADSSQGKRLLDSRGLSRD